MLSISGKVNSAESIELEILITLFSNSYSS